MPYVGSGILASAVGMDKVAMKRAFRAEGLPVTPYVWFDEARWRDHPNPWELVRELRRPLFVKPCSLGSSIGISRVAEGDDLAAAVGLAFGHDRLVIVEQGVSARELECRVLGGQTAEASVVGEVTVAGGWFDYRQKYLGDADPMIVPAALPPDVTAEVRHADTPDTSQLHPNHRHPSTSRTQAVVLGVRPIRPDAYDLTIRGPGRKITLQRDSRADPVSRRWRPPGWSSGLPRRR